MWVFVRILFEQNEKNKLQAGRKIWKISLIIELHKKFTVFPNYLNVLLES